MQRDLIDRYAANILALSPALRTLLGTETALWPYSLSQLLSELDVRHLDGKIDVSFVSRMEAKLRPLLKELVTQHEYDVSVRVTQLLSGGGVETIRTSMQPSFATPAIDVLWEQMLTRHESLGR